MKCRSLDRKEGTLDVFLPDADVTLAAHSLGVNPSRVRFAFLDAYDSRPVEFQLVGRDGQPIVSPRQQVSDVLFWSWVPIFSERGRNLMVEMGCEVDEFVSCGFTSNPGEAYFAHLPRMLYDVVDTQRSTFLMTIPGDPPIPHHIQKLVMSRPVTDMPHCFRAPVPGHSQVFGELLVSEEFESRWFSAGLTGGVFRPV